MVFTDTVTIYQKQPDGAYKKTTVTKCQWSNKITKSIADGKLQVFKNITVTFKPPFIDGLANFSNEDAVIYGDVNEMPATEKGNRLSDLLTKYKPNAGIIREVNDNSKREHLKNIKVVMY